MPSRWTCRRWHTPCSCRRRILPRRFRLAYGETSYTYLMTRRIERAMALLRRGDLTVTEVCLAVGASSLGSFSVRFTELVGQSPSAYRAAQRADPVAAVVRMGGSDTTQQNLVRDVDALVAAFMSDAPLDDIVPLVDRIATAAEYWDDIPDRAIIELRSAII
jgi:AraC-like DNA-binding protein